MTTTITRQDTTYELGRRIPAYSVRVEHLLVGDVTNRGTVTAIAPTGRTITFPGKGTFAVYAVSFSGTGADFHICGWHRAHDVEMDATETVRVTDPVEVA